MTFLWQFAMALRAVVMNVVGVITDTVVLCSAYLELPERFTEMQIR
jgi:hypothetical protein